MTVNYTSLLALGQPVTGTESGTWGDDVNNAVTSYLDIAIAGTLTLTGDGSVTLANTQGTNTATNIGSTTAQYYILKIVGPLTATKVITAPSSSKTYLVNNTDSTYGVTVKASGQTGVTVAANTRAVVAFNGTDYVVAASSSVSNLSGLGTGVATALGTNVGTAGAFVVNGGALGTPSSGTLTNATGLPISTGVSGLGTGVATALAVNTGTAGAFVVNGGALGTPSSGTVTNLTGTASININGTVGATSANTGAFTTLSATGNVDFNGGSFVFNDSGADKDARFEGDTDANLLFTDASTDRVGIGTNSPSEKAEIYGTAAANNIALRITNTATDGYSTLQLGGSGDAGIYRTGSAQSGYAGNSSLNLITVNAHPIGFSTNNVLRAIIDSSGNVLVGTTTASGKLTIDDNSVTALYITGNSGNAVGFTVKNLYTNNTWVGAIDSVGGFTFNKDGSDFWYAGRSGSANCVSVNGSWVNSSDKRLKENIAPLVGALEKVCKLRGVEFDRKATKQREIGLIAQEVQAVYPEAVEDSGEYLGLNYGALVGPLVAAIQEQQAQIEALKAEVAALKGV